MPEQLQESVQTQADNPSSNNETVYQATSNRATVVTPSLTPANQEDLTDEELEGEDLIVDESDEELPDLGDLPEDPEEGEGEEDEFEEGSPRFEQFKSDFQKAFGLPMEEARELVQSLKQDSIKREINEQKYELSAAWEVPVTEVDKRLAIVAKMWEKLPADKKQAYDSTKGAQVLYSRYEQQLNKKGATKASQTSTKAGKAPTTGKSRYAFTQQQIDAMDAATYSQNADAIMLAYAQGRVKR